MMTERRVNPRAQTERPTTYRVTRSKNATPYCTGLASPAEAVELCKFMNQMAFVEPFHVMPDPEGWEEFYMSRSSR